MGIAACGFKEIMQEPEESSRSPLPKVSENDLAMLQIKAQRDSLILQQKKLTLYAAKDDEDALKLLKGGSRDLALLALRRKKLHTSLLSQCTSQLMQVEQLASSIEFSMIQANLVATLEAGNLALKRIQDVLSVVYVEDLVCNLEDSKAHFDAIDQRLSEAGVHANDADVEKYYAELQQSLMEAPTEPLVEHSLAQEEKQTHTRKEKQPHVRQEKQPHIREGQPVYVQPMTAEVLVPA